MLAFLPGGSIGPVEMMVFGILALLLFGKRLPEVAKSLGKGMVEFKRGIKGVQDEFHSTMDVRPSSRPQRKRPDPVDDERQEWTAPRFEPPKSEPISAGESRDASASG